ncbi:hypothetical protein [Candidatus Villigracilis affinis]|uniref:hypothetical protein n=1 Tax=Candidatus Villigracilis affinis TaxID=3140682 RepID=UPI002A1B4FBB|nr:hypothetical protein [Anaerolineales bacterium]
MNKVWYVYLGWVVAAGVLGFAISMIFSGILLAAQSIPNPICWFIWFVLLCLHSLERNFHQRNNSGITGLGLGRCVLLTLFTVKMFFHNHLPKVGRFCSWLLICYGRVVYGLMDALLLTVLPVLAIWQAFTCWSGLETGRQDFRWNIAVFASVLVTAAYHLGIPNIAAQVCLVL